jgi:CRISPR-associated exonuclease Cas4
MNRERVIAVGGGGEWDRAADGTPMALTVTDVKNFLYCRRIPFHGYLLGVPRPQTFKMAEGKRAHADVGALEARRSLRAYGLREGERFFDVRLRSERLGLDGRLDMVIRTAGELIPVDFKDSMGPVGLNHRYQLTAYALLVEEAYGRPVRRGFIYLIPARRAVEVVVRPGMRRFVHRGLRAMRRMIAAESMPPPTRHRGRCTDCEFRRYCNDVD